MQQFEGGYLMTRQPIIKSGQHAHTSALDNPVSPMMLNALNAIQATPFATDPFIAHWMKDAFEANDPVGDIPLADPLPLPPRFEDAVWATMTKEARHAHKADGARIHDENARMIGKRRAFKRKLKGAFELMLEPAFYMPHNFDFRSRIYPLPQDLNPQGDDIAKALLRFAIGKPITAKGTYWLCVAIANAFGEDKTSMDARVQWTMDHSDLLCDSVDQPLDGRRFWATADEPWCALALAYEFVGWLRDGDGFVSHRPINLDATCSGMQHLSALGRDPVGAKATNLTDDPERQDLYIEVAKVIVWRVERDAGTSEVARAWLGHVTRKTVKRAIMTTPYGCTDIGIKNQLIQDGHCKGVDGEAFSTAEYMKDCIKEALSVTAKAAKEIMTYIQGVAKALAEQDIPFDWTTPTGFKVRQAYYNKACKRVVTLFGETWVWNENSELGLNVRKQTLAAAPNFVHALDASHLAKTVNACVERGITSFAMIHDSFGTHACDVPVMCDVLRESFVSIYRNDWLALLEEEVRGYAPKVKLPARPVSGDFDVTKVLDAPFFFS